MGTIYMSVSERRLSVILSFATSLIVNPIIPVFLNPLRSFFTNSYRSAAEKASWSVSTTDSDLPPSKDHAVMRRADAREHDSGTGGWMSSIPTHHYTKTGAGLAVHQQASKAVTPRCMCIYTGSVRQLAYS